MIKNTVINKMETKEDELPMDFNEIDFTLPNKDNDKAVVVVNNFIAGIKFGKGFKKV